MGVPMVDVDETSSTVDLENWLRNVGDIASYRFLLSSWPFVIAACAGSSGRTCGERGFARPPFTTADKKRLRMCKSS